MDFCFRGLACVVAMVRGLSLLLCMYRLHPRSLTASLPLKNGGTGRLLSYWEGNFSGANC